jgi:hypothetical protein
MLQDLSYKVEWLERTMLELGGELFRAKFRLDSLEKDQKQWLEVIETLKQLLDTKGVIERDDFEEAIDLDRIMKRPVQAHEASGLPDDGTLKKVMN